MRRYLPLLFVALAPLVPGQTLHIPEAIENLQSKATESVHVTLDAGMLEFARRMMGDSDPEAKRVMDGLKAIRVRSFEFDKEGAYSPADVESMRKQLAAPAWSRIAEVRGRRDRENVDVYMKVGANRIAGMVVLVAAPRELTIVDLDGSIRPEDLHHLRGRAGLHSLDLRFEAGTGRNRPE